MLYTLAVHIYERLLVPYPSIIGFLCAPQFLPTTKISLESGDRTPMHVPVKCYDGLIILMSLCMRQRPS